MRLPALVTIAGQPGPWFNIPYAVPHPTTVDPTGQTTTCLRSPCFLDSFDQPILYYRATPANSTYMATNLRFDPSAPNPLARGIYNLVDNYRIAGWTTGSGEPIRGMDFGHGLLTTTNTYHYLSLLGNPTNPNDPSVGPSFSRTIWNPNVVAPGVFRPYNDQSFILLSAGQDGVFGTSDDIANFEVNH
jgi:hypothetical protein